VNIDVPLCDLTQQYLALKDEIDAAVQAVAVSGKYILGPNVAALEREIAAYCQCRYAAGVNSGTDALHLALRALEIGPGDEVITTPFTFVATSEAIRSVGATPVFADIHPRTYNLDAAAVEPAITPRTKVILPVHLFGQPCDMDRLAELAQRRGLAIVEDCAQSIGAAYGGRKTGSFGKAGCLSFFPSKNLGCFGDGGMVVTNDPQVYERVEMLRRHGGKIKYHHEQQGLNSRLDEMQAAVLRVKFKYLEDWNSLRRRHAYAYNRLLAGICGVHCPAELGCGEVAVPTDPLRPAHLPIRHVYHQYTVSVSNRERVFARLVESKIGCAVYYPVPLHLQQVNADLGYVPGAFPIAERVASQCISLPMFPELRFDQQQQVAEHLREMAGLRDDALLAA
jgi:dTDP-4-amino-4,6-dideoxygalactose transaminase